MSAVFMICTKGLCPNENTLLLGLIFCTDCKSHEVFTAVLVNINLLAPEFYI
jgi:hypothetical protein